MLVNQNAVNDDDDAIVADGAVPPEENASPVEDEQVDDLSLEDEEENPFAGLEDETETPETYEVESPETQDEKTTKGRDARIEKLDNEIGELRQRLGIEPNVDVRVAVKERNLLREMAEVDIRSQQLQLERELLGMENPNSGDLYTPNEAASIARAAAAEAEANQVQAQSRELTIERNQGIIEREVSTAMSQFPIYQETLPNGQQNPAYDKQATELAGQHLLDAYITEPVLNQQGQQTIDQNGQPQFRVVGIKRSPIEILKSVATSVESYRKNAEGKAAQNLSRQSASADVPLNGSPGAKRKDSDEQAFDEVFADD